MSWEECVVCRLFKPYVEADMPDGITMDASLTHVGILSKEVHAVGTFGSPPFFLEAALYFTWSLCWLLPLTPPHIKRTSIVSDFSSFFVHLNWNTLFFLCLGLVVCLELGAKYASKNVYKTALNKTWEKYLKYCLSIPQPSPLLCLWRYNPTWEWKGKKKISRKKMLDKKCCIAKITLHTSLPVFSLCCFFRESDRICKLKENDLYGISWIY